MSVVRSSGGASGRTLLCTSVTVSQCHRNGTTVHCPNWPHWAIDFFRLLLVFCNKFLFLKFCCAFYEHTGEKRCFQGREPSPSAKVFWCIYRSFPHNLLRRLRMTRERSIGRTPAISFSENLTDENLLMPFDCPTGSNGQGLMLFGGLPARCHSSTEC